MVTTPYLHYGVHLKLVSLFLYHLNLHENEVNRQAQSDIKILVVICKPRYYLIMFYVRRLIKNVQTSGVSMAQSSN